MTGARTPTSLALDNKSASYGPGAPNAFSATYGPPPSIAQFAPPGAFANYQQQPQQVNYQDPRAPMRTAAAAASIRTPASSILNSGAKTPQHSQQ